MVTNPLRIFVSSVQKELAEERRADYQNVASRPQRTAARDLNELVQKGVLELEGKGRGARYRFLKKRAINAPNTPSENS